MTTKKWFELGSNALWIVGHSDRLPIKLATKSDPKFQTFYNIWKLFLVQWYFYSSSQKSDYNEQLWVTMNKVSGCPTHTWPFGWHKNVQMLGPVLHRRSCLKTKSVGGLYSPGSLQLVHILMVDWAEKQTRSGNLNTFTGQPPICCCTM